MELIFATNNSNKVKEIQAFTNDEMQILSLAAAGITEEIEEPYHTFKENAWAKAMYVYQKTGKPCFAEDSGLVVPALDGAPGVLSARYAGVHGDDAANNAKLVHELQYISDRAAYYIALICLVINEDEVYYFEGKCHGTIGIAPQGTAGFGYDPLFIPEGYQESFGQLGLDVKKSLSHRSKAIQQLVQHLDLL